MEGSDDAICCYDCGGPIHQIGGEYECRDCGTHIPEKLVRNADDLRELADSDLRCAKFAALLVGGD